MRRVCSRCGVILVLIIFSGLSSAQVQGIVTDCGNNDIPVLDSLTYIGIADVYTFIHWGAVDNGYKEPVIDTSGHILYYLGHYRFHWEKLNEKLNNCRSRNLKAILVLWGVAAWAVDSSYANNSTWNYWFNKGQYYFYPPDDSIRVYDPDSGDTTTGDTISGIELLYHAIDTIVHHVDSLYSDVVEGFSIWPEPQHLYGWWGKGVHYWVDSNGDTLYYDDIRDNSLFGQFVFYPEYYVDTILKPFYNIIRKYDPQGRKYKVIGGTFNIHPNFVEYEYFVDRPRDSSFYNVTQRYKNFLVHDSAYLYLDVIGVDFYTTIANVPDETVIDSPYQLNPYCDTVGGHVIYPIRDLMDTLFSIKLDAGCADAPIWIMEMGFPTYKDAADSNYTAEQCCVDYNTQAEYLSSA